MSEKNGSIWVAIGAIAALLSAVAAIATVVGPIVAKWLDDKKEAQSTLPPLPPPTSLEAPTSEGPSASKEPTPISATAKQPKPTSTAKPPIASTPPETPIAPPRTVATANLCPPDALGWIEITQRGSAFSAPGYTNTNAVLDEPLAKGGIIAIGPRGASVYRETEACANRRKCTGELLTGRVRVVELRSFPERNIGVRWEACVRREGSGQ